MNYCKGCKYAGLDGMDCYSCSAGSNYVPNELELYKKENAELKDKLEKLKANEWHYPSKGEYPKECENVLCYCKVYNVQFYAIGHTIIGGDNKIRWWSNDRSEKLKVYAWKDITPPKEVKENEN